MSWVSFVLLLLLVVLTHFLVVLACIKVLLASHVAGLD